MHLGPRFIHAIVVIVVAGVLPGCFLTEKVIRDKYLSVPGVQAGFSKREIIMRFPEQYCIPPGALKFSGTIEQEAPLPQSLSLIFLHWDPTGTSLKSAYAPAPFTVMPNGTIPKQERAFSGFCFAPSDNLEVRSAPTGGDVQEGARVEHELRFKASEVSLVEERILEVEVSGPLGTSGEVQVPTDKQGNNQCSYPPRDPRKSRNTCHFVYDVPEGGLALAAVAFPGTVGTKFDRWGGECGTPGDPFPKIAGEVCQFLLIGNFDRISARFTR